MIDKAHNPREPDAVLRRTDPLYAQQLFLQLKQSGISQREVARRIGVTDRILRAYVSGEQSMPYTVQYAIESLASATQSENLQVREPAAQYRADMSHPPRTFWHRVGDRPIGAGDAGKIIVGRDRFGSTLIGLLARDNFGLIIRELHNTPADCHSVPIDRVDIYTLLDPPRDV